MRRAARPGARSARSIVHSSSTHDLVVARLRHPAAGQLLEDPRVAERAAGDHHRVGSRLAIGAARRPAPSRARRRRSPWPPSRRAARRARVPARSRGRPCAAPRRFAGAARSPRRRPPRPAARRGRTPDRSPGSSPERSFTVTGRPEPSGSRPGEGEGEVGPSQQLRAGARLADLADGAAHVDVDQVGAGLGCDRRRRAHHLGVVAEQLDRDRVLAGWIRSSSRIVRSLRWCRPKLETISETASPAPWRRACRRTNQLPIPASGASSTRLAIVDVADPKRRRERRLHQTVSLPDQAQAGQGEQVVHLVDHLAERDDRGGVPAGGDEAHVRAELALDAAARSRRSAPGEAVDDAGLQARVGGPADHATGLARRLPELDRRQLGGRARASASMRDLHPGADHAAQVLAGLRDHVERDRGAEVDDGAGAAEKRS